MAEGKKSFIIYTDWKDVFDTLSDEKAGILIKHIFSYVNDEHPETDDILIKLAFAGIKQQLKRDLVKWRTTSEKRSEIGRTGGIMSGLKRTKQTKQLVKKRSKTKQTQANEAGNVNVNDNVNEEIKEKKEEKKKYSDFVFMTAIEYEKLISEHGEKNTQTFIGILNNYKGSNGRKYKSDYLAILNWVIDRAKKDGKYVDKSSSKKPQMVW